MEQPDSGTRQRQWHQPVTLLDWVTYVVGFPAGVIAFVGLLPSLALAVALYGGRLFPRTAWWLLIPYVLFDLFCLYWWVVARTRGRTLTSGIPLVSWSYYFLFSLRGLTSAWYWRVLSLALLTVFHVACQVTIPGLVAARIGLTRTAAPRQPVDRTD